MRIITKLTDPAKTLRQLRRYKVVSFDIFDTLITRTVPDPHDVFSFVERVHNGRYPSAQITGFRERRVLAERTVRAENDYKEITFEKIYAELSKKHGVKESSLLMENELKIEYNLSIKHPTGFEIFRAAKEAGLRIILTSDMYLPKEFIGQLLAKNDVSGYSDLFVSSDSLCMKSDGTLYDHIHEKLQITANEMVHIGDNLKSDFIQPRKKGGGSFWIPKARGKRKLDDEILLQRFLRSKSRIQTIEEDIGYNKLGPLLFGFSHWMRKRIKEDNVEHLLFLARDGKLMQDAFKLVNNDEIDTDYLYVSRQVLILPTLWMHPDLKDIEEYASISEKSDVGSVLERLGLRETLDQSLLDRHSLSFEHKINGTKLSESESFVALYDEIRPMVIERSKKSYYSLISYLQDFKLSGKIGVVDIGWNGSMQRALTKILNSAQIEVEVIGYYFGANPTSAHVADNDWCYNGYLFEHDKNFDNYIKEECFRNVFETLFLARHGSVREVHEDGEIEMYDYEYEDISESISVLQKSSIQFVREYTKSISSAIVNPTHKCYYSAIFKMGLMPTKPEAKYFGYMKFFDVGLEYVAKVQGKNFIRGLLQSKWKTGYLVNLTGMCLPYYIMIQWLIRLRLK